MSSRAGPLLPIKILPASSYAGRSRADVCRGPGGALWVYGVGSQCVDRILSVDTCMNTGRCFVCVNMDGSGMSVLGSMCVYREDVVV